MGNTCNFVLIKLTNISLTVLCFVLMQRTAKICPLIVGVLHTFVIEQQFKAKPGNRIGFSGDDYLGRIWSLTSRALIQQYFLMNKVHKYMLNFKPTLKSH